MDGQALMTMVKGVVEDSLSKMSGVLPSSDPESKASDIVDYEGRMRAVGTEKFNAPSYVSVVSFYLNKGDMERHKAKGAMVLYMDAESSSKLFKFMGFSFSDDEDDASMMNACGEYCTQLADAFKKELVKSGHADLVMSSADNYKNSVLAGVPYSTDQKKKYELLFSYWKRKVVAVEVTLGGIH